MMVGTMCNECEQSSHAVHTNQSHITFACIALAFLTVISCLSFDTRTFQQHDPKSSTLDDFKRVANMNVVHVQLTPINKKRNLLV